MYSVSFKYDDKLEKQLKLGGGNAAIHDDEMEMAAADHYDSDIAHINTLKLAQLMSKEGHKNRIAKLKLSSADAGDVLVGAYAPDVDTAAMDVHASETESD